MSSISRCVLLVATASLAVPAVAQATTYYASPNGTSTTCASPFQRCQLGTALKKAGAGDTVAASPGTYKAPSGGFKVPSGAHLRGSGNRPVIEPAGDGTSAVVAVAATDPHRTSVSNLELRGRLLLEDRSTGSDLWARASVVMYRDTTLRNALVVAQQAYSAIIVLAEEAPATIDGVTAIGGSVGILTAREGCFEPSYATVRNTIARGDDADLAVLGSDCNDGKSNLMTVLHSNFRTAYGAQDGGAVLQGTGNQTAPEQTDDATIFDGSERYRQREGAPTANAGTGTPPSAKDLDGDPRVAEGAVDIGADELPAPRAAQTRPAKDVTATAATLHGVVTAGAGPARVSFEYGAPYGSPPIAPMKTTLEQIVPAGEGEVPVSVRVEGLASEVPYRYRLRVVTDAAQPRTTLTEWETFTTPPPGGAGGGDGGGDGTTSPGTVEVLSGLKLARAMRVRRFLRRGLRVRFVLGVPDSRAVVRLRARVGKRTVTLARRVRTGADAQSVRLRPTKKGRRLLRRYQRGKVLPGAKRLRTRLIVAVTPPGQAKVKRRATVRLRR